MHPVQSRQWARIIHSANACFLLPLQALQCAPMSADRDRPHPDNPLQPQPRVWALLGHKAGDNNQVLALAEALGLPFEKKVFSYRRSELLSNLFLGPTLLGTRGSESSVLEPPWPDLVITSGRRNEPVARWIREQGGPGVRIVHIGRPWTHPENFDLVITTPQYELAEAGNVMRRELPMHRVESAKVTAAVSAWKPRLSHLAPPYIAVLIGGQSGPYYLDTKKARRLAHEASALAQSMHGALLVTSSARTPAAVIDAFADAVEAPNFVYRWAPGNGENPYLAFLGLADAFIVTSESMSMLAEACAMQKPVYMFDMDDRAGGDGQPALPELQATAAERWINALRYKAWTHRLAQGLAPRRMRRDIGRMHRALLASGRAVWLGQRFPHVAPPPLPDGSRAVERVRDLLALPDE